MNSTLTRVDFDGDKLRTALKARGWGSFELALKMHVSESLISKMIKGERQNAKKWAEAAKYLKVPLRSLMMEE